MWKVRLERAMSEIRVPLQPAAVVFGCVVVVEDFLQLEHLLWQVDLGRGVGGPVALREHVHRKLDVRLEATSKRRLAEGSDHVSRQIHVLEHTLQLGSEARAAFSLELRDHRLLRVDRGRFVEQQPLGEVLFVESLEQILAVDVAEESHRLVEHVLELLLRRALVAAAELGVDEARDQLCRPVLSHVDEALEAFLQCMAERLARAECLRQDLV
mmetsp:Transcript_28150/g.76152  ORF Transcript_28150/g.76152 Transcript_28150/m.76152 type:complete len:213 (+) Transcript_28150:922-1560(+)